jgi:DNA repair photolyase
LQVREIRSKTILTKSKIYSYAVNPYVGCQHGCRYCYARFMKKFTGHDEPWGDFVDVKINAPDLLAKEIVRKTPRDVWISGVCDPYQPLEEKYMLTRRCLEILVDNKWPVFIQTRSPLVTRDIDILVRSDSLEAGLSVTTADDRIRYIFEPNAPSIKKRLEALEEMHRKGIRTYAMIAPMLPRAETLPQLLAGKVDHIIVDRMNYHYADRIYRKWGFEDYLTEEYFYQAGQKIALLCNTLGIPCRIAF